MCPKIKSEMVSINVFGFLDHIYFTNICNGVFNLKSEVYNYVLVTEISEFWGQINRMTLWEFALLVTDLSSIPRTTLCFPGQPQVNPEFSIRNNP